MNPLEDSTFDSWSRAALAAHLRRHPVDATFIGVHEHDHRLPDVSPEGLEETLDTMKSTVSEVEVGSQPSDAFAQLDRRLVRGFLKTAIWEHESGHVAANPSVHAGDAVFGLMGPLLTRNGSSAERREAVAARLAGIPSFFSGARETATGQAAAGRTIPSTWARRAIRECHAGARFVEEGLAVASGESADEIEPGRWSVADRAAAAESFRAFAHLLETEVLPAASDDVACGGEAFEMYLQEGHFLTSSADDIVAGAREEMAATKSWLESGASDLGASSPPEILARLQERHPEADDYLARFGETWAAMRDLALARDLVTWPDFPIEYVERPGWARSAAPDLYFLSYRAPPAIERPEVHRYLVAPLDGAWSREEQVSFLQANNDSVIKLNHVIHHGGIGHHVQNWNAYRSPSLVGRIAAVDCASRIAMFCGGTVAEGWSTYTTGLMAEAGALTADEQFAEHAGRVKICARAIVDVELHHGRMSLAEAAVFYQEELGMPAVAAHREAVKCSMFPGVALMYLVGTDMIRELRRDVMRSQGDDFVLRDFHDALLSYGAIPLALIAEEMRRRAEARLPLGAHDDVPGEAAWMTPTGATP